MIGFAYDANFFRAEIERLSLLLTQPVSTETRLQLKHELWTQPESIWRGW